MDSYHPGIVLQYEHSAGTTSGTYIYNWITDQKSLLSTRYFDLCGPRGLLFTRNGQGAWRFSVDDPAGKAIDHMPTHIAQDGSLQVYALEGSQLWASSDGGLTWEQRQPPSGGRFGKLTSLVVSESDAQAIYVTVLDDTPTSIAPTSTPQTLVQPTASASSSPSRTLTRTPSPTPTLTPLPIGYLFFSSDAGRTWELRGPANPERVEIPIITNPNAVWAAMPGASVPANMLLRVLSFRGDYYESSAGTRVRLSTDGGRTLNAKELGSNATGPSPSSGSDVKLVYTPRGIVRRHGEPGDLSNRTDSSTDGGQSWRPASFGFIGAVRGVPGFLFSTAGLWEFSFSLDSGQTWHIFSDDRSVQYGYAPDDTSYTPYELDVTPYFPVTMLGVKDVRMQAWDLPADGSELLSPALPSGDGATFFPGSGHNLSGIFQQYWQQHGDLPQQGLPITEPFMQVSDVDGKIYRTQYFERAVFELHPENQPPYNVLLSLLGAEAYKQRYGSAGAPNQHVSTDNPLYFPQTGHTIGGRFRQYWESHGGLAQQGYPISDEFTEVSALDGKPYTVQYFQRAEFEYHPENQPPNDVLLSQLGTLKAKQLGVQLPQQ